MLVVTAELLDAVAPAIEDCASLRHVIVVGQHGGRRLAGAVSFETLVDAASPALEPEPTSPDAPAFWLYSSGSTGQPKGCVHLHHDMKVCADAYARGVLGIHERDRCFSVAKLFFAYGLGNSMYFPFAVGATTILWPGPVAAPTVYDIIERYRPTLFFSVPTHYAMLLAHTVPEREFNLSSIRAAVSAGEALPPTLFERFRNRFGIEILDGIGSTEILHIFISNRRVACARAPAGSWCLGTRRAWSTSTVNPCRPAGWATSSCAAIRPVPSTGTDTSRRRTRSAGHWIRTGDRYSQDDDGFFWFAGRSDDMLKVGGIWVSPAEVEHLLLEHPAVQACGVTGREDHDGLIKPVAHVVPGPGRNPGQSSWRHCSSSHVNALRNTSGRGGLSSWMRCR